MSKPSAKEEAAYLAALDVKSQAYLQGLMGERLSGLPLAASSFIKADLFNYKTNAFLEAYERGRRGGK
jgi:hypothetical protein